MFTRRHLGNISNSLYDNHFLTSILSYFEQVSNDIIGRYEEDLPVVTQNNANRQKTNMSVYSFQQTAMWVVISNSQD